jgi:hypothetical protein
LKGGQEAWVAGTYGLGTIHVVPLNLRNQVIQDEVDIEQMWRRLLWLPPWDSTARWYGYRGKLNPAHPNADPIATRTAVPPMGLVKAMNIYAPRSDESMNYNMNHGHASDLLGRQGIAEYLVDIPGVAPLPLSWLFAFSLVYLICIGPLDYFVLKRIGKQPWTWVTFPVYIVLFSGVAMVGTAISKGDQAMIKRLEIVDVLPGTNLVRGTSHLSIFATTKTKVSVVSEVPSSFSVPTVSEGGFMEGVQQQQGMGSRVLSWGTQTWTLAFAATDWVADHPDVNISVHQDAQGSLTVKNESSLSLSECEAFWKGGPTKYWSVGSVESRTTTLNAPTENSSMYSSDDDYVHYDAENLTAWSKQVALTYREKTRGDLSNTFTGLLVCMTPEPLEKVEIKGLAGKTESLNVIRIPFELNAQYLESL